MVLGLQQRHPPTCLFLHSLALEHLCTEILRRFLSRFPSEFQDIVHFALVLKESISVLIFFRGLEEAGC